MTPVCMAADELALWLASEVRGGGSTPCVDCPLAFAAEMRAQGRCNGKPRDVRPMTLRLQFQPVTYAKSQPHPIGRTWGYATEAERIAARRQSWREYGRRKRANARAISLASERESSYDSLARTSSESVSVATDAVPSASPRRYGVVAFGGRD